MESGTVYTTNEQGAVQISCSPGTYKLMESNPEMLTAALSEAGVISMNNGTDSIEQWFAANQEVVPEAMGSNDVVEPTDDDEKKTTWLDAHVKFLLASVEELRPQVGKSPKLKSKKKMWTQIERRFQEKGYKFNGSQIENKYRTLERQYKKVKAHNKQTGQNKAKCPFESELTSILGERHITSITSILGERPCVFPELILGASGSGGVWYNSDSAASSHKDGNFENNPGPSNGEASTPSQDSESRETQSNETPKKVQKIDVGAELQAMREERSKYYKQSLEAKREHYKKQEELKQEKINVLRDILEVLKK